MEPSGTLSLHYPNAKHIYSKNKKKVQNARIFFTKNKFLCSTSMTSMRDGAVKKI